MDGEAAIRDDARPKTDPVGVKMLKQKIVNIHIPKTAGSTLQKKLREAFSAGSRKPLLRARQDLAPAGLGYYEQLRSQCAVQLQLLEDHGCQLVTGHYRFQDIRDLIAPLMDRISLITFLRDPAARMISDYYYSISDRHPTHREFKATYPEFETYALFEGEQLKQLKYLQPYEGASVDETIEAVRSQFDFVGFTETFEEDLALILGALDCQTHQSERVNESPNRDAITAANEKYRDLLVEVLHDEYLLYQALLSDRKSLRD